MIFEVTMRCDTRMADEALKGMTVNEIEEVFHQQFNDTPGVNVVSVEEVDGVAKDEEV